MVRMRRGFVLILALVGLFLYAQADAATVGRVQFKKSVATMQVGSAARNIATGNTLSITYRVLPSNATDKTLTWSSTDESVATVEDGVITAHKPGACRIAAQSINGKRATLKLKVTSVPVKKVVLSEKSVQIALSDTNTYTLTETITPSVATNQTVTWQSSNKKIATVEDGVVTFHRAGTVRVRCRTHNKKTATCTFRVRGEVTAAANKGVGRALVLGESRKNTIGMFQLAALPMVPDEVNGIAAMLASRKVGGKAVAVSTLLNSTRAKVLSAIQSTFAGATDADTSFLYLICHGGVSNGNYLLFPAGDGYITAKQLRAALEPVKGTVVVMLGCCESGDIIGKSASFQDGFMDEFFAEDLTAKSGELASGKYLVLTACKSGEYGYGVASSEKHSVYNYGYNLFGYALAEGAGYDLLTKKSADMAADTNGDGNCTLRELYAYTYDRVHALYGEWVKDGLFNARESQNVQAYPADSDRVLFSK